MIPYTSQDYHGGEMRKRDHFVGIWLDNKEQNHLDQLCTATGFNASTLIRKLIAGTQLRPRPPDQYAALLRELAADEERHASALAKALERRDQS